MATRKPKAEAVDPVKFEVPVAQVSVPEEVAKTPAGQRDPVRTELPNGIVIFDF